MATKDDQVEVQDLEDEEIDLDTLADAKEEEAAAAKKPDERLANERKAEQEDDDALSDDEKRERRREERRQKKLRQREAMKRDKIELNFLRQQNEALEKRLIGVERRQVTNEVVTIDGRISQIKAQIEAAETIEEEASAAGNTKDAQEARRIQRELSGQLEKVEGLKKQRISEARTAAAAPQGPQNPPAFAVLAAQFVQRNPWFSPNSGDEDSAIVFALDHALSQSGEYDKNDPAYWNELERRVKKRLPHKFKAAAKSQPVDDEDDDLDDTDDDADEEVTEKPTPRSGGPRIPAKSNGGGGNKFVLSAARKDAMVQAGVWDDEKLRAKYIRKYMEWDRQNVDRKS